MTMITDVKKLIRQLDAEKVIKACNYHLPLKELPNRRSIIIPVDLVLIDPYKNSVYLKERCYYSSKLELGDCECAYHRIERVFRSSLEEVAGDLENIYGLQFVRDLEIIMSQ